MNSRDLSHRPSLRWGFRMARRLWRLVLAVWFLSVLVSLPAAWVVDGAASAVLGGVGDRAAPAADPMLVLLPAIDAAGPAVRLALASAVVTLWAWTILWHSGTVGWTLWHSGRRPRLGEILGFGVVSWWRYGRLSLTALGFSVVVLTAIWLPNVAAIREAYRAMAEQRMVALVIIGLASSLLTAWIGWSVTLRAAWLIGLPARRSVLIAWLRAFADTVRSPVASLAPIVAWVAPAAAVSLLPIVLGHHLPQLRGELGLALVGQAAAAIRAFAFVGLFLTYAPVTGLVATEPGAE